MSSPAPRTQNTTKRSKGLRRLLIGLGAVVLVIVLLVVFVAPMIAASYIERTIDITRGGKVYKATIDDVTLSLLGPQRVRTITLTDQSGVVMAAMQVEATTSLLGALFSGGNLGRVTLTGSANIREDQLPVGVTAEPPVIDATKPAPTGAAAKPLELPTGLEVQIDIQKLDIAFQPSAAGSKPVSINDLNASVDFAVRRGAALKATAAMPALNIEGKATNLFDSSGIMTLLKADAALSAEFTAPGEFIDALARFVSGNAQSGGAAPGPARGSLAIVASGGRLKLADVTRPATIEASIPAAMVGMFAGEGAKVSLASDPTLRATISALDLPLPDTSGGGAGGGIDLRGAVLRADLTTSVIEGSATLPGSSSARSFRVDPVSFTADAPDLAGAVTIKGQTRAVLDGSEAGALALDLKLSRLLDDAGAPRAGLPGSIEGEVTLKGVPTRLAEPFAGNLGATLTEALGETLNMSLSARTRDEGTPTSSTGIPPTDIVLDASATNLTAYATLSADAQRITGAGEAVKVAATRIGPLVRHFMRDSGIEIEGAGRVEMNISDIDIPMLSMGLPDLRKARATIAMPVTGLIVSKGVGDRPLEVQSATTRIVLAAEAAPRLELDWSLNSGGRATTAKGGFELTGLLSPKDQDWPFFDVTPDKLRPTGSLTIADIPSDLMGMLPADMRDLVARSIGPDVDVTLASKPGDAGAIDANLSIKSQGLAGGGDLRIAGQKITSVGEGISLTIAEPGPLAEAIQPRDGSGQFESITWTDPLTISVSGLEASLPEGGKPFNPGSVAAVARVTTSGLAAILRDSGAGATFEARRLTLDDLDAKLTMSPAAGASIELDGSGQSAGQAFTMDGNLALGKLYGDDGTLNIATLAPKGTIELKGVPTALVSVFDARNGSLAKHAIGPSLDLAINAPAPGESGSKLGARSVGVVARGQHLAADFAAGIDGKKFSVGDGKARLVVTPGLVDAALAVYAPDQQPRPVLEREAALNLVLFPFSGELNEDNSLNKRRLTKVNGMVTVEGPIVARNLPGGANGATLAAGLRDVNAGFSYDASNPFESESSLKATLFEPSRPDAALVELDARSALANPPPGFEIYVKNIDAVGLDRWLGRPGLISEPLGARAGVALVAMIEKPGSPQDIVATIDSERLQTTATLRRDRERYTLVQPAKVNWEMSPAWANAYLVPKDEKTGQPSMSFRTPTKLALELKELALAAKGNYLQPAFFRLGAAASSPSVQLTLADGRNVTFEQLSANVATDQGPGSIGFNLHTQVATDEGRTREPVSVNGVVRDALNSDGSTALDRATITADAKGTLPTVVLDAIGNQKGVLVDLLGQTTKLDAKAENLSKNSGTLSAEVTTDNARASLAGSVAGSVFTANRDANITLHRITRELSARYLETVLPLISSVEKTEQDDPAVINATGLTLPTDGDTRKLNGTIVADLGTMRFGTSNWFGGLVKAVGGKSGGKVGERIKPFTFLVNQGVVTYEKIEVPLGEFKVETRGKVDLNEKTMDIITLVPFSALADEIARGLGGIPGLDALTIIPIRTHGPFGRTKSEPQLDLIVTEAIPGALEKVIPEDIKKVIPGDLLKDIFKKKKD